MTFDRAPPEKLHAAHDRLFRRVFSRPEHARGALQHMLPTSLVDALEWSSLTLVPGSYVDELLQPTASDLLFSISMKQSSTPALLYLLFEHQSTQPRFMPVRMLGYSTRALCGFLAQKGQPDGPVPKIVPLVLYQGPGRWISPRRLSELHGQSRTTDPGPLWLDIEILVHELGREHLELLRVARQMTALARATLVMMKLVAAHRNLRPHATLVADLLEQVRTTHGARAIRPLLVYLAGTRGEAGEMDVIMQSLTGRTRMTAMTLLEQLEARGFARGEAALLLKQLRLRFGPLPGELVARVRSAEVSLLDRWAERILSAIDLDEVFAP